jgi:hypothetical protein
MIGRVTIPLPEGPATLILHENGTVESSDPDLRVQFLAEMNSYQRGYGPGQGRWGAALLRAFAQEWGGQVEFGPQPPLQEGMVY